MNSRKLFYSLLVLVLLGVGISIAGDGVKPQYSPNERAAYLPAALETVLQPGLNLVIQQVTFTPPTVAVTFRIADNNNQGLDRNGVVTPGPVSFGFVLARIRPGDTQYTSYITSVRTNTPTGAPLTDPNADSTGTYADLGDGVYKYTFATQLTSNVDTNSTTTLGIFARRDLSGFGFPLNSIGTVVNVFKDFVPSGAAVTQVRDVVTTAACNQCHNPLALHGGRRIDVRMCVLCHQPQNTDPPTLGSLDFKVYIHKIHMGANLPSVTGKPLNINGMSGSGTSTTATGATQPAISAINPPAVAKRFIVGTVDYSTVVWPQDVRNCTTCHKGGTQSDNYKTNPSRAACGSCHDNVNFATGLNHPGGVMLDDTQCTVCHKADTGLEFDLSVSGAHTLPWKSKQLAGLKLDIVGVSDTKPGDRPTVWFKATDSKGNPVDASKLGQLGFVLAGPTTDYTFPGGTPSTENALPYVTPTGGGFFYKFATAIPANATGATYAIGAQGYQQVTIASSLTAPALTVRDTTDNPVFYFGVGGATAVPRRTVVDVKNCNVCHDTLKLHGSRVNTQFCVLCHNPSVHDTQTPAQTVNFRTHIHRIHTGVDLENEWTINGTNNFNGVRFPGDRRDCAKCHVNNSNQVPVPDGLAKADTPRLQYSPMWPTAQACLGCHDGDDAAAHAYLQTAPFGESCPVCHQEGAEFAVSKVHAR